MSPSSTPTGTDLQTIKALSIACESHYPPSSTAHLAKHHHNYSKRPSPWHSLFSGLAIPAEDMRILRPMIAKYARHIRRLTICSLDAFRLFEHHCMELTALHCRFEPHIVDNCWVYWHGKLAASERHQARKDVHAFAMRQTKLVSINYTSDLMDRAAAHAWLVAINDGRWRHFDVYLDEEYYHHIDKLLPNVRSARFSITNLRLLRVPLPEPHRHLRELQLWTSKLEAQVLAAIVASFPSLRRLVVRCDIEAKPPLIDLTIDNGSMLYVGPGGCPPGEIGHLLANVPQPLLILDYADKDFQAAMEAVAEHCQDLLHFECAAGPRTGPYVLHGSTRLGASRRSMAIGTAGRLGLVQSAMIHA
ncbi:hypothetical protein BGZ73_002957 [Actinomortierella ambigua]|nr:hypothetical protein BGZ73_002957 [Actinomortierella ambigua]